MQMSPACYMDVATDGVRKASRARAPDSPVPDAEVLRPAQAASADGRPGMQCRSALSARTARPDGEYALPMMARSKLVNLRKMKIGQTDKGK
jgi:hypothetical protein